MSLIIFRPGARLVLQTGGVADSNPAAIDETQPPPTFVVLPPFVAQQPLLADEERPLAIELDDDLNFRQVDAQLGVFGQPISADEEAPQSVALDDDLSFRQVDAQIAVYGQPLRDPDELGLPMRLDEDPFAPSAQAPQLLAQTPAGDDGDLLQQPTIVDDDLLAPYLPIQAPFRLFLQTSGAPDSNALLVVDDSDPCLLVVIPQTFTVQPWIADEERPLAVQLDDELSYRQVDAQAPVYAQPSRDDNDIGTQPVTAVDDGDPLPLVAFDLRSFGQPQRENGEDLPQPKVLDDDVGQSVLYVLSALAAQPQSDDPVLSVVSVAVIDDSDLSPALAQVLAGLVPIRVAQPATDDEIIGAPVAIDEGDGYSFVGDPPGPSAQPLQSGNEDLVFVAVPVDEDAANALLGVQPPFVARLPISADEEIAQPKLLNEDEHLELTSEILFVAQQPARFDEDLPQHVQLEDHDDPTAPLLVLALRIPLPLRQPLSDDDPLPIAPLTAVDEDPQLLGSLPAVTYRQPAADDDVVGHTIVDEDAGYAPAAAIGAISRQPITDDELLPLHIIDEDGQLLALTLVRPIRLADQPLLADEALAIIPSVSPQIVERILLAYGEGRVRVSLSEGKLRLALEDQKVRLTLDEGKARIAYEDGHIRISLDVQ